MPSTKLLLLLSLCVAIVFASPVLKFRSPAAVARDGIASRNDRVERQDATSAYMQAQEEMFAAEMAAQNKMQTQTTEEEEAQAMNDAAFNPKKRSVQNLDRAAGAPMARVRRQDTNSLTEAYMEAQEQMFAAEMAAQNEMQTQTTEEEFAHALTNPKKRAVLNLDRAAAAPVARVRRQDTTAYMEEQQEAFEEALKQDEEAQNQAGEESNP